MTSIGWWALRAQRPRPGFEHCLDVLGWRVVRPFALGDNAAAPIVKRTAYAVDSLVYVCRSTEGQSMLPVDFTPEGDLPFVPARQFFDVHAEHLGVDGVHANFYQIGEDGGDLSV